MTFASPLLLLLLLAVPAVLVYLVAIHSRPSRNAVAFTNIELLTELVGPRRAKR